MNKKIKLSQVGVGYWGPNILRNLVFNDNCDLITVVDTSDERRSFIAKNYPNLNVSEDFNDILEDKSIDGVVISTPVKTHYELSIKALSAGKHILVEKPMATSVKEVNAIEKLAAKNKLVAMVGHTFLFNPAVTYLKKIIDNNLLGDIRYIYSQRLNLGRIRSDVDALWNLAPHDVSIIQYWLGDPKPISYQRIGMDYVQKNIDDVVFMNIKYENNIMANIHVSWLDPNKVRRITIVGSKKMVVYDDLSDDKIVIFDKGIDRMAVLGENMDFDNPNTFSFNHRFGDVKIPKIGQSEPLKEEITHFINCILGKEKCVADAKHAEKVVGILSERL